MLAPSPPRLVDRRRDPSLLVESWLGQSPLLMIDRRGNPVRDAHYDLRNLRPVLIYRNGSAGHSGQKPTGPFGVVPRHCSSLPRCQQRPAIRALPRLAGHDHLLHRAAALRAADERFSFRSGRVEDSCDLHSTFGRILSNLPRKLSIRSHSLQIASQFVALVRGPVPAGRP